MSEAPKMVKLAHNGGLPNGNYPKSDLVEYTRADLADALAAALRDLRGAVCGEDGFAQCVRDHSGTAYPWPALDLAEEAATAALAAYEGRAILRALEAEGKA